MAAGRSAAARLWSHPVLVNSTRQPVLPAWPLLWTGHPRRPTGRVWELRKTYRLRNSAGLRRMLAGCLRSGRRARRGRPSQLFAQRGAGLAYEDSTATWSRKVRASITGRVLFLRGDDLGIRRRGLKTRSKDVSRETKTGESSARCLEELRGWVKSTAPQCRASQQLWWVDFATWRRAHKGRFEEFDRSGSAARCLLSNSSIVFFRSPF